MEIIKKIYRFLGSRLARNAYLWICIVFILSNNDVRDRKYEDTVYYTGIFFTTLVVFVFTYLNNLILVPKYLARKKRGMFLLLGGVSLVVFSFIYISVLKLMVIRYPQIEVYQFSLITSPVSTSWLPADIFFDIQTLIFALFIWQLALTLAWYANDYTRQQKALEEIKKKQVETELHFLKNQINPHFLFNTLNNLYSLALKKSDKNPDAILRLSSILRYLLYDSNVHLVSSEKETEIMRAYIDLELLRLPADGNFTFDIDTDKTYLLPPLLWMPILENIFKHATGIIADKYFINYNFSILNNVLRIRSRNNRKNKNTTNDKEGGIGLTNLHKRLELLYPGRFTINTDVNTDFYAIDVEIKL